jgi:hypothetical protein
VKVKVPVSRLLDQLGLRGAKKEGRLWRAVCPNPDHDDRHPSWTIIDDGGPRHGSHWCHACGFGGGPWELAAAVKGLSLAMGDDGRCEAGEWVWENVVGGSNRATEEDDLPRLRVVAPRAAAPTEMAIPNHVHIPSVDGSEWYPRALAYLEGRGIPEWQLARWHIGWATLGRCAWRVFVPVYTGGRLLSYVARAFVDDGRPRYDAGRRTDPGCRPDAALFGEPGFDMEVRVATVTEGVFKALAMERADAPNPCAVLGANNLGADKINILSRFDALLVATDPDKAGRECWERIADLTARYVEPVRVELARAPDDASVEENGAAWREAIRRVLPTVRARRLARLGAT